MNLKTLMLLQFKQIPCLRAEHFGRQARTPFGKGGGR